jgi:hypothetical protein
LGQEHGERGVSKRLREKRFEQKYRYTLNESKYDGEIWNSKDVQFFALRQEGNWENRHQRKPLTQHNLIVALDLFLWRDSTFGPKDISKQGIIRIPAEQTLELYEFLSNKPVGETFVLPSGKLGAYHLSFEKRGLFGQPELSWKFLFFKEHWDNTLFLPTKKCREERKQMKDQEQRHRFWFTYPQVNVLAEYLNMILP